MDASRMAGYIQTALGNAAQVRSEGETPADPTNQLVAFCQGIINEIENHAKATGTDTGTNGGSDHSLDIS